MTKRFGIFTFVLVFILSGFGCKHKRNYNGELLTDNPCDPNTVYFQNTILPLLVTNCGFTNCHNSSTIAAGIDVTSYTTIMNAAEDGLFVDYDHPNSSSLYQVVSSSEMPPYPYPHLSSEEVQWIYDWIDQGAFNNYCAECDTANYTFKANIWPLIETHCTGCHQGPTPSGGIPITNYSDVYGLVATSELPGVLNDPANYLIMPFSPAPVLYPCDITKILKWISDGAPNN